MMLLNTLLRWIKPRVRSGAKRRRPPRAHLEVTALERRAVPALIAWEGTVSDDWTVGGNWGGGQEPRIGDDVSLREIAAGAHAPRVPAGVERSVRSLFNLEGFAGKTLTIDGQLTSADTTLWNYGNIAGAGKLNMAADFAWDGQHQRRQRVRLERRHVLRSR